MAGDTKNSSSVVSVSVESLLFDLENPRFPDLSDQRSALHAFCGSRHSKKTVVLAESIAEMGLNPAELLIVIRADTGKKFIVVEGNRRLAALKLLTNPARIKDSPLSSAFKVRLKRAAEAYAELPTTKPTCRVIPSRETANYWIALKHTGENDGIGVVAWDGEEKARFRGGSPTLKLLDYVRENSVLSDEAQEGLSKFPVTNLERLFGDPSVRGAIGIEISGNDVYLTHKPADVLKALTKIVEDIASGNITVTDIKLKSHRSDYVKSIRSHLPKENPLSEAISLEEVEAISHTSKSKAAKKQEAVKRVPPRRERASVIPKKLAIEITLPKVNEVYVELQRLNVKDFPTAASALLRIFIDTTTLEYVNKFKLDVPTNNSGQKDLRPRIEKSISDFASRAGEPEVGKAAKNAVLQIHGPIYIEKLHLLLHGRHEHPSPDNLRLGWDGIEPWMQGMWSLIAKS